MGVLVRELISDHVWVHRPHPECSALGIQQDGGVETEPEDHLFEAFCAHIGFREQASRLRLLALGEILDVPAHERSGQRGATLEALREHLVADLGIMRDRHGRHEEE